MPLSFSNFSAKTSQPFEKVPNLQAEQLKEVSSWGGAFALGPFFFSSRSYIRNEEITTRKMVNFQYVKRFGCFFVEK